MSSSSGEVTFQVVEKRRAPRPPKDPIDTFEPLNPADLLDEPAQRPRPLSMLDEPSPGRDPSSYLDEPRYPLAGPIVREATGRKLKGLCSRCDSKLRLRVRGPGTVKVRCPICGHSKRIRV